ncbi:MAG: Gfo/Idh/MocA family oxidoreductase [Clostridiales bacterium]|jgi:predicted dehydrogenase|nr:Gfo/Idh/MocA family oxidoreductase [Clostridiales bacterium]
MGNRATIGIIGCGHIARDMHFGNAFSNPRLRVKWCCDLLDENLAYAEKNYAPEKLTKDYMDVLNDPEVQGVMILTTHDVRLKLIEDAAARGKHIYAEKPMATDMREAYGIMKAVRQANVKLVVGFNRRCAPIVRDAMEILGRHRANPVTAPWRYKRREGGEQVMKESKATMVLMRINDDYMSFKSYAMDPYVGHGAVMGELCHFVDLACKIVGCEPVKVYAEGWARINQSMILQFEDQSICTIVDAAVGSFDHPKELIEIYHKGLSLQLDFYLQLRAGGIEGVQKIDYPFKEDMYPEITEGEGSMRLINKAAERNRRAARSAEAPYPVVDKGHYGLLDRFADCVLLGAESPCDELDGARATLVALKAVESARLGLPVKISVDEYDFVFREGLVC